MLANFYGGTGPAEPICIRWFNPSAITTNHIQCQVMPNLNYPIDDIRIRKLIKWPVHMIAEIKYHRNFDKSMKSDIETR